MLFKMLYSTKIDGNMSKKYDEIEGQCLNNRKNFFSKNNIELKNTLAIKVKNSTDITEIGEEFINKNKNLFNLEILTDCIITKVPNLFVYLPFGDCIPLAIFDNKQNILAFAHLGWQSTELNLHLKIIDVLKNRYNSNIEDLEIMLGPSIKKESYIKENPSQLKYKEWNSFLTHVKGNYYKVDLNGYIVDGLNRIGIKKIINSEIDTAKDDRFFSHHRCIQINKEEKNGRFICGTMMEDNKFE